MKIIFSFLITLYSLSAVCAQNDTIKINSDLILIKINESAFVHISYMNSEKYGRFPSNGLIYINDKKAIIFDTPVTDDLTEILLDWMIDSMHFEVIGLVINHWHNDCQEGIEQFHERNIKSYSCNKTIEISKEKNLPIPNVGFIDSLQIVVGESLLNCYYLGEAHSSDNIVCYIPSEKILWGGCMIKSFNSRGLGSITDANLQEWPKTIQKVIQKFPDAEIVIPGHGDFGDIQLINHTLDLLVKQN
jgi:metallo-beta-lactamase class B